MGRIFSVRRTLGALLASAVLFSVVTLEAAPTRAKAKNRAKPARSSAKSAAENTANSPEAANAAALLDQVLRDESAGRASRRAEMLADLINRFPDYAPARWQAGQVRTADGWRSVDEAAYEMAKNATLSDYRRLRSGTPDTGMAQHQLADWCRGSGLSEQDRVHRIFAISLGVARPDDYAAIGLHNHNGTWLTPEQIKKLDAEQAAERSASNRNHRRLLALRREILSDTPEHTTAARAELARIITPSMLPLLERLYSSHSEEGALAALEVIERMPGQEAINSLARHAVFAKWPTVRTAAAERLHDCSLYSYAPLLLSGLATPINAQFQAGDTGPSTWQCRLLLYREGLNVDTAHVANQGVRLSSSPGNAQSTGELLEAQRAEAETMGQVARTLGQVQQFNQSVEATNGLIASALSTATGVERPATARSWWDWWYEENDMYRLAQRPVYQTASSQTFATVPIYSPPRAAECFAPGTQVWTSTGAANIEKIVAGDFVLAQDIVSGELAFKPVLATTTRPPTGMLLIRAGHDTITATRGHPFWVSGAGWRMAKELQEGDVLHTVSGTISIDAIEQVPDSTAHNLVVDGFSSYFVGTERILVHDNELRLPTDNAVPGLGTRE